ncbi:hypothetical protein N3K66_006452 [Trichothecium roseum]|uniref:Uncharacterized protein n=1 Tax=Trichothecium roseum TaxID=47278 RepID=A0ACC0UVF7_9HYPO|nr:hypothetical protein N3K66_006452 [Trichothecium roseum]
MSSERRAHTYRSWEAVITRHFRFDDGEVVRYGAGESWRPTPRGGGGAGGGPGAPGERSPRRPRSPRERDRSRPRSPRPRSPPISSDSYIPGRYQVRRRSQSRGPVTGGDRYRRDARSRERESPPPRRERTRSPMRRPTPRRSVSRRRGTPRRGPSPPRGDRYDRPRSPPRQWERDRERDWDRRDGDRGRELNRDRERERSREDRRDLRRDDRRSRSPFRRERSPVGRSTPMGARGGGYRPRSRTPERRREDRFYNRRPSPHRESGISSAITSQSVSRRSSPRPPSIRGRSPLPERDISPRPPSGPSSYREVSGLSAPRSPPRGPAALRGAPPTGPAASRNFNASSASSPVPSGPRNAQTPGGSVPHRTEITSPSHPPAGPRGYVPPARGGFGTRGGRGGWGQAPPRHVSGPSPGPPATTGGAPSIPTGPRAASAASSTPTQGRPFNPPTGPAAGVGGGPRQSLAQSLLATMPPIIPGGKLDPAMTPLLLGVTKDLEPHYRKLRDEEEKLREEMRVKQERLRKSLYMWDRLEREARAWELRSDLSEKSMKSLAGEGMGGAAF